jgi:hypothetical protein
MPDLAPARRAPSGSYCATARNDGPFSYAQRMRPFGLSSFEAQEVDLVIAAMQKLVPVANLDHDGRRDFLELEARLIDLIPPNTMP